jgi:Flp pilus assembly pilin Flp
MHTATRVWRMNFEVASAFMRCLRTDTRGSILLEYAVLIGSIALAGALGLVAVGIALVRSFDFARALLLSPIP